MGAWGALIMSFFGAAFLALALYRQWHVTGLALALPFAVFALIGGAAGYLIRLPGDGMKPSEKARRAIVWSSVGEGIGLLLVVNIVTNMRRPDLLLPAMALVVGLHFLPIAYAASFRPYYLVGAALILSACAGVVVSAPIGGMLAGAMAASGLWLAATLAVRRDWRAKNASDL